jgi:Ni,Fe-hydrogenase III small subunit
MESPWRTLEQGIRMSGVWGQGFYGFQRAANVSVTARVLAVLVAAENNAALLRYTSSVGTPNWIITQWSGLATSAVSWPVLKNAPGLLAVALGGLRTMLSSQVYPDGVETEQAAGYDMVTASDYFGLLSTVKRGGGTVEPAFLAAVEQMWDYGSYVSDPDGFLPRNGDTDLMDGGYSKDAADFFGRPDWTYINSNGASGSPPTVPSIVFPWAGQAVFRSGFDKNATWAWFDGGPYGSSGHADRDKLQVVLHARGTMLLIDSGRFEYSGDTFSNTLHRLYKGLTHAHNTLTIDGAEQQAAPALAAAPLPPASYATGPDEDRAFADMALYDPAVLKGAATHTRGVVYTHAPAGAPEGDFLVVVDRVTGDRPRSLSQTWHAHPNASVTIAADGSLAATVVGAARRTGLRTGAVACVVPLAAAPAHAWDAASVVTGVNATAANGNEYQGWVSFIYNDAIPAPTLVYTAANVPSGAVLGWVLYPHATAVPGGCAASVRGALVSADAAGAVVRVTVPGAAPRDVTVPLA